jgi:hypothetical protein
MRARPRRPSHVRFAEVHSPNQKHFAGIRSIFTAVTVGSLHVTDDLLYVRPVSSRARGVLERLTKWMLELLVADEGAADREEGFVDVGASVVAAV